MRLCHFFVSNIILSKHILEQIAYIYQLDNEACTSNANYWKVMSPRCLKITKKVSFNIASEASYVYILSGQTLIKNDKNGPFWRAFENLKLAVKQCYQTDQF